MQYESPECIRLSKAADILLGFSYGKFYRNAFPFTINILLHFNSGCIANCLYCGQAREVASSAICKTLIRVEWPLRPLENVIERISRFIGNGTSFRPYRICVSDIEHPRAVEAEIEVVRRLWSRLGIPISVLISPTQFLKDHMKELKSAGAERIGIALDCATKELFETLRGFKARSPHKWERYMEGVNEAVEVMGPGKVGIHLIVGLGETEEEAIKLIQLMHDSGVETHLFSFYPEQGSILEKWLRPPVSQYRRVQLARYLINNNLSRYEWMRFDSEGHIIDFGITSTELNDIIETGLPFVTSGCPGCNRPYANERPSEFPRNFPYIPRKQEIEKIKKQLSIYTSIDNNINTLKKHLAMVYHHG
jgi:biotin synthase-related radical SAM superfamily protein